MIETIGTGDIGGAVAVSLTTVIGLRALVTWMNRQGLIVSQDTKQRELYSQLTDEAEKWKKLYNEVETEKETYSELIQELKTQNLMLKFLLLQNGVTQEELNVYLAQHL